MDSALPLPASSSHASVPPVAFAQLPLAPASSPRQAVTTFAADPSTAMRSARVGGSEDNGRGWSIGVGERAGGMASLPRSASLKDGLVFSRDWATEGSTSRPVDAGGDGRKGSEASWRTQESSQSGRGDGALLSLLRLVLFLHPGPLTTLSLCRRNSPQIGYDNVDGDSSDLVFPLCRPAPPLSVQLDLASSAATFPSASHAFCFVRLYHLWRFARHACSRGGNGRLSACQSGHACDAPAVNQGQGASRRAR